MPSLYDAARKQELLTRLERLAPETPARWGKFTSPKMVAHLIESFRMASGELKARARPLPLQSLFRYLAIHVIPFPKGAPTAPELLAHSPASWGDDFARLRTLIAEFPEPAEGSLLPPHPAFGPMSKKDWGVLGYKHTDHHFRQFGI